MTKNYEQRIIEMTTVAASDATILVKNRATAGQPIELKLYYLPAHADKDGSICICVPGMEPEGAILASNDVFGGSIPYAAYYHWIRSRISRLPILGNCA